MRFWKLQTRHWLLLGSAFISCAGVYGLHRTYELRDTGVEPNHPLALTCVSKEGSGEATFSSIISPSNLDDHGSLDIGGTRSEFSFRYVGKRGPTDWYRVTWTTRDHPGSPELRSEEFSFRNRQRVVFDDKRLKIVAAPWDGHSPLPRN